MTNCLDIIRRPSLIKNDVSEIAICLRHQVKHTPSGPIDTNSLDLQR
jgi:hypothetical protein